MVTPEKDVSPKFFPFEFTPLYVGMPSVATYNKPIALGGGFVEPLGFNSQAPRKKAASQIGAEVCLHLLAAVAAAALLTMLAVALLVFTHAFLTPTK